MLPMPIIPRGQEILRRPVMAITAGPPSVS
jgi:hypothetical protein